MGMYQFLWPLVFLLLPLPFFVRRLLSPTSVSAQPSQALKVPFFSRLEQLGVQSVPLRGAFHSFFWWIAWAFFVIAAARPVWLGAPVVLNKQAQNIVLSLDVSGSMEEEDFDLNGRRMTRLQMVKKLAKDFIDKRKGDNLGLVIFGSEAYSYAPLSPDTETLTELMDEIDIGIAGSQTAMGDALAMAVQSVMSVPENARIVILMSDGFANAGTIQMEEALQLAKTANVRVYTIGIGSDRQSIQNFLGFASLNPTLDLDEETLRQVANQTGGQYFRAKSTQDLREIYNIIDQMETTDAEELTVQPRKEMAYLCLLAGLVFWILAFSLKEPV